MKWKAKPITRIKEGDARLVRRFLFLPLRLGDEWRWLEVATILQKVMVRHYIPLGLPPEIPPYQVLRWVDNSYFDENAARELKNLSEG